MVGPISGCFVFLGRGGGVYQKKALSRARLNDAATETFLLGRFRRLLSRKDWSWERSGRCSLRDGKDRDEEVG